MGQRFNSFLINKAYNQNINAGFPDYDGYAVTPADGSDLPNGPCKAIYVTVGGNVNVQLANGNPLAGGASVGVGTAVLTSLVAGQILPIAASRILSTSTTATGIFALY
jgi:hypothetical protein